MKQLFFPIFAAALLLMGATGCSKDDSPSSDHLSALEQSLVGLWWDEFEYADVTETGVSFSRVLLAVKADANHTGCIYLGVFDDTHSEPLAVYGGPQDAAFTWRLLDDGSLLLGDPATGESAVLTRGGGSYGDGMTNVSATSLTYNGGSMSMTNGSYAGTLEKADAEQATEIEERLHVVITAVNSGDSGIGFGGHDSGSAHAPRIVTK